MSGGRARPPVLAMGGPLIARALPLDALALRRTATPRGVAWRVPGWARAIPPAATAAVLFPLAFLFLRLGEPGLGPAVLCGILGAAALGIGWLRGAFQGTLEVRVDGAGAHLRQGRRSRQVPRSIVEAVQAFGPEYWERAQHGGWRVRYALGLRMGHETLVLAHSRSAARLERAGKELAAALRLPYDGGPPGRRDAQAPSPKRP